MTVGRSLKFEPGSVFREAEELTAGGLTNLPEILEKISALELSLQNEFSSRKIAVTIKIFTFPVRAGKPDFL